MLVLTGEQVRRLLDMQSCIDAVEAAFRSRALGGRADSAVAGVSLEDGKLHAKLATLDAGGNYAVTKINANIPANPSRRGLPSIQGVVVLFDAVTGVPLALMDSGVITAMRTAAASAVAARWLALDHASSLTMIGCGVQARAHVEALLQVRPIRRVRAYDLDPAAAHSFCAEMQTIHGLDCTARKTAREAADGSEIVVTSTPSRQPILGVGDVAQGTFIAAVGTDSEDKHELTVDLLRSAAVVVDDIDQCARIGDLHHALLAGATTTSAVRASLDQVVSGRVRGRIDDVEIVIFDSTGVAIEDAAAGAIVYEKAQRTGVGTSVSLTGVPLPAAISGRSSS